MADLHPSFDPDLHTDDAPFGQDQYRQEQMQQFEYAIEVELAQLRSAEAGRIQLSNFCRLLQETREEQIRTRELLERLMNIVGAAA